MARKIVGKKFKRIWLFFPYKIGSALLKEGLEGRETSEEDAARLIQGLAKSWLSILLSKKEAERVFDALISHRHVKVLLMEDNGYNFTFV